MLTNNASLNSWHVKSEQSNSKNRTLFNNAMENF